LLSSNSPLTRNFPLLWQPQVLILVGVDFVVFGSIDLTTTFMKVIGKTVMRWWWDSIIASFFGWSLWNRWFGFGSKPFFLHTISVENVPENLSWFCLGQNHCF
jgi:hypothetical protein